MTFRDWDQHPLLPDEEALLERVSGCYYCACLAAHNNGDGTREYIGPPLHPELHPDYVPGTSRSEKNR